MRKHGFFIQFSLLIALILFIAPELPAASAKALEAVSRKLAGHETRLDRLENQLDMLEKQTANRLSAHEKWGQAKVDEASRIAQIPETGRKDLDWRLTAKARQPKRAGDCDHLRSGPDLDNLRGLPWFKTFVAGACGES